MIRSLLLTIPVTLFAVSSLRAAETLPQTLPYQQQLRKFMATLEAEDFQPVHKDLTVVPIEGDADDRLRLWILSMQPHSVGRKRNYSSVMLNSSFFTLDAIEDEKAILRPPAHPEPLVDLANWNYPGNPYSESRPLRLRAFVLTSLDMIMMENLYNGDDAGKPNQNQLAGAIGRFAYVYPGFRDVVPVEVRDAYLAGLKKLVLRALDQGPTASTQKNQGMFTWAAPALFLSAKLLNDADINNRVDAYAKKIFTEEPYFRGSGYFPNGGTLDSFNGISTYFAVWGALAGDSPHARDAIEKVYDLRSHLTLPDPDGTHLGPSHMGSLTSAESAHEQWDWPMRTWGAALVADTAVCLTKMPDSEQLQKALALTVAEINFQLHELSLRPDGMNPAPWAFQVSGNLVNFAYQYYPKGYHARRAALDKNGSSTTLPVLREGSYLRNFKDEIIVAKTPRHAAIVHLGPISETSNPRPAYGFGGGALSAFWTRETGTVILGRGVGAFSPQYAKTLEEWRSLPSHAVTGITRDGTVFTSAHIVTPTTTIQTDASNLTITARGHVPSFRHDATKKLAGKLDYVRKLESRPDGLSITTTLSSDDKDELAELYEVVPVFLREAGAQTKAVPTTIEIEIEGKWGPATEEFADKVRAVRLTRFGGSATITFDRPRRVKLAPPWADTYQTRSACRNLLIDMLEKDARMVSYRIEAVVE